MAGSPALDVVVEPDGTRGSPGGRENQLRVTGGELLARLRCPGLNQYRLSLRGPRDVQRPLHRVELTMVVEPVHLDRIEEDALLLVAHKGIVLPRVP